MKIKPNAALSQSARLLSTDIKESMTSLEVAADMGDIDKIVEILSSVTRSCSHATTSIAAIISEAGE